MSSTELTYIGAAIFSEESFTWEKLRLSELENDGLLFFLRSREQIWKKDDFVCTVCASYSIVPLYCKNGIECTPTDTACTNKTLSAMYYKLSLG